MPTHRSLLLIVILCSQVLGVPMALAQGVPDAVNRFIEVAQKPDLTAYPAVTIFTRVLDESRRAVPGLAPADLVLEEDGRPIADFTLDSSLGVYRAELPDCFVVHLRISLAGARERARTRAVHLTEDEFDLRKQVTLLETRLSQKGKRVRRISLAECLDEAMRSQRPLEEWFTAEREQGVETIVETYLGLRRGPEETFLMAYRRVGDAPFRAALYAKAA